MATSVPFLLLLAFLLMTGESQNTVGMPHSWKNDFKYGADNNPDGDRPISNVAAIVDPLCALWRGSLCIKCARKAYFDSKGRCLHVDPLCQKFDQ